VKDSGVVMVRVDNLVTVGVKAFFATKEGPLETSIFKVSGFFCVTDTNWFYSLLL
jgi:hypothetical protein